MGNAGVNHKSVVYAALVVAMLVNPAACAGDSSSGEGEEAAERIKTLMAVVITTELAELRDMIVVGAPIGPIDDSVDCPMGGTLAISGTLEGDDDRQEEDFDVDFSDCGISSANPAAVLTVDGAGLSLTGWAEYSGNEFVRGSFSISGDLDISGEVTDDGDEHEVDESGCDFGVTREADERGGAISGSVCGETISDTW